MMGIKAVLFLLFASGSLSEGKFWKTPPFPGVNSERGTTREPQSFHCTEPVRESTSKHKYSEDIVIDSTSPQLPLTSVKAVTAQLTTKKSIPDRLETFKPTTQTKAEQPNNWQSSSKAPNLVHVTAGTTKQLTSTPSTSPGERYPTSDQQATTQLTLTPPTSPTEGEITSDEQATKQPVTTSPVEGDLTSDQQNTVKQLASTPPSSPPCPSNMVLGPTSDCERTCQDPISCSCERSEVEACVCPNGFLMYNETCIPEKDCGCYNGQRVIAQGDTFINEDCSMKCVCNNSGLHCDSFTCGSNAHCKSQDDMGKCNCDEDYVNDDETCIKHYTDCNDAYRDGNLEDGVYSILPHRWKGHPFKVHCNMSLSGGGWTVFQRRSNISPIFDRDWNDYKDGFGSLSKDFWLGNEKLFYLTSQKDYKLRLDIVADSSLLAILTGIFSSNFYEEYGSFKIENETNNFTLLFNDGGRSGTLPIGAGIYKANGNSFSTKDRNGIVCNNINCAKQDQSGWWYGCSSSRAFSPSNQCTSLSYNKNYLKYVKYVDMKVKPIHDGDS